MSNTGKKKRGLSIDDKKKVILSIYHDRKEPFNLKEIENIASKMGVVQQTVKDVNQSLVDDNLVLSDKIGAANFFWSFPSKVFQDKIVEKQRCLSMIESITGKVNEITRNIELLKKERCANDRPNKLRKLNDLINKEKEYDAIIDANKMMDPIEIKKIENQIEINFNSVNRWTDNIYSIKKYLIKKKGLNSKDVDKMLQIDSKFDYLVDDDKQYAK